MKTEDGRIGFEIISIKKDKYGKKAVRVNIYQKYKERKQSAGPSIVLNIGDSVDIGPIDFGFEREE